MEKKNKSRKAKLDILNQTRDRTLMPRPAIFRNKKKYDRNALKDEDSLEDAMDAMDDAINAIGVVVDELEEEELDLDEEFDEEDDPGVPDGLHIGIVIGKG